MKNIYDIRDGSIIFDEEHCSLKTDEELIEEVRESIRDDMYFNPDMIIDSLSVDAWPEKCDDIIEDLGLYLKSYADLTKDKEVDIVALSRMLSKLPKEIESLCLIGVTLAQHGVPYIEKEVEERLFLETGI